MKSHNQLWAVTTTIGPTLVAGEFIHLRSSRLGHVSNLASGVNTTLEAIWQWVRVTVAHVTTTQLIETAALAWLVFVVSLVLLARSRPSGSGPQEHASDVFDATTLPDVKRQQRARLTQIEPHMALPPLDVLPMPDVESRDRRVSARKAPHAGATSSPVAAPDLPNPIAEQHLGHRKQREHPEALGSSDYTLRQKQGHVLAMTGVSPAYERLLPYGLFIVAEDTGITRGSGKASRSMVEVIAEQMVPALAGDLTLGSAEFAALLKMAVIRASIDLRQQCIRTDMSFEAAVTGVMVVGDVAHIVTLGDCRTYMFRPHDGLMEITTDHLAVTYLEENGLLEPRAFHTGKDNQAVSAADTVGVSPDDLLLLCSPGLRHALHVSQIEGIMRATPDPRNAAELLAREGASRARERDISSIVVRPQGDWAPRFGVSASQAALL